MSKFRLLQGVHGEGKGPNLKVYYPGDVIETESDLCKFNTPSSSPKFEKLDASGVPAKGAPYPGDQLDAMTVERLREFAAEEEIDLVDARKRDDILQVIRRALQPV